ncbi:MAG UNVERIFIED_CONTAM: hypothetical protein LVR29_14220 [Microcystis novacekii LVE1205-3]|jgi:hypothetical protein
MATRSASRSTSSSRWDEKNDGATFIGNRSEQWPQECRGVPQDQSPEEGSSKTNSSGRWAKLIASKLELLGRGTNCEYVASDRDQTSHATLPHILYPGWIKGLGVIHDFPNPHPVWDIAFFGHVTDATENFDRMSHRVYSKDTHRTALGIVHSHDVFDQRGISCTIAAD